MKAMFNKVETFILGFTLAFVIFGALFIVAENNGRKIAIDNNCAYYHPETGKFTWKNLEK